MILKNGHKFQLITSAAGDIDSDISFGDSTGVAGSDTVFDVQVVNGIVTAAITDILATPAAATFRKVLAAFWRNKHASQTVDLTLVRDVSGTDTQIHKWTLKAGEMMEYLPGLGFNLAANVVPGDLLRALDADANGQNVATAQPWFPSLGAVTVEANTTYRFLGWLHLTHGATTHTIAQSFGGTATLTSIDYNAEVYSPTTENAITTATSYKHNNAASAQVLNATSTAVSTVIYVEGIVRISAAGTFIPNYTFSANPTGTILSKRNSFFRMEKWGPGTFTAQGLWA